MFSLSLLFVVELNLGVFLKHIAKILIILESYILLIDDLGFVSGSSPDLGTANKNRHPSSR